MKFLQDSKEVEFLEFGIVQVGLSKILSVTVVNDSETKLIDLSWSCEGVEILDAPKELDSGDRAIVSLRWTPSIDYKKPLKVELKVEGKEIYGYRVI